MNFKELKNGNQTGIDLYLLLLLFRQMKKKIYVRATHNNNFVDPYLLSMPATEKKKKHFQKPKRIVEKHTYKHKYRHTHPLKINTKKKENKIKKNAKVIRDQNRRKLKKQIVINRHDRGY